MLFVTVVLKFASSPNAAASSFNVSKAEGDESTKFVTAVSTYAVVATLVELSLADCVVAVVAVLIVPFKSPTTVPTVSVP